MTRKKLYIICLSALTLIAAAALFCTGFYINARSAAKTRLLSEISSLEKKSEEEKSKQEELTAKLSDLEAELSTKDTMNNYYMEYQKEYDSLTEEIENLKQQSASLDAQIEAKQTELEKTSGVSGNTKGKSYTINKDEIYTCPNKIPAGRYTVTGSGSVVIYSSSGKPRATENLDVAYNNSYTFNLAENEQFKVSGSATLTELK